MNKYIRTIFWIINFEKADIFVNQTTNQAIAMVSYNVTYVSDLKNANQSKTNQTETRTVKCLIRNYQVSYWSIKYRFGNLGQMIQIRQFPKLQKNPHLFHYCQILRQNDDIAWKQKNVSKFSILDVANRLGISFKQVSSSVYEHPEHDSFRIFFNYQYFLNGFSRDIQGDVIDFVRLVKGISFKEALAFLSEEPFKKKLFKKKERDHFIIL